MNDHLMTAGTNRFLVAGAALLIFFLACCTTVRAEMVSIAGDNVNLRPGPGTNYRVMWLLGEGFPLIVLKRSGSWLRVKDFEGTIGWVHQGVVNDTPHMIVKVHKNSRKRIHVRSGPGTGYPILAKAYYGVVFTTLQQKNGWVNVRHEQGVTGWIKRSLLWGW